jgi:hypothetical protein
MRASIVSLSGFTDFSMTAMRLRFFLFVLALAVQALSPVASGFAAGGIARAGLSEICLKADVGQDNGRSTPGHSHSHQRDCPLCQAFCDGVSPVEASAAVLGATPVQWATLQWSDIDNSAPAISGRSAHRARAPPAA